MIKLYNGRAGRLEFFTCLLGIWLLAPFILGFTFGVLGTLFPDLFPAAVPAGVWALYYLAAYTAYIMLIVRRFHDLGKSGWSFFYLCIPLVGFYFFLVLIGGNGTEGSNKFGDEPPTKVLWFARKASKPKE